MGQVRFEPEAESLPLERPAKRWRSRVGAAVLLLSLWTLATPSSGLALDSGRISTIRRADNTQKLLDIADKIIKEDSSRKPKDFEEGTQIATEMAVYLLYIQIRQNEMLLEKLQEQLDR